MGSTSSASANVTLPVNNTVDIWFGFSGDVLRLQNATSGAAGVVLNGICGQGEGDTVFSTFGQFAFCNAPMLYTQTTVYSFKA